MAVTSECYFASPQIRLPNPNPPGEEPPNPAKANPEEWYRPPETTASAGGGGGQFGGQFSGAGGGVARAGGNVSIDSFKWAWSKIRSEFIGSVLLTVGYGALVAASGGILSVVVGDLPLVEGAAAWMGLMSFVLLPALARGFLDMAQSGGGAELGALFRVGDWVRAVPTSVIVGVAMTAGYALFVLPGLILTVLLGFAVWFALDDTPNPLTAIQSSIAMVRANLGSVIVLMLLGGILSVAGAACFVGLVITVPMSLMAWTYAYVTMRGRYVQF